VNSENTTGPLAHLLALDVEATCDDGPAVPRQEMETIEIGAIIVSAECEVIDEFKTFIGRKQITTDVLHPGPANLLRLAFGREEPEYREGDALPPAWLACYFLPGVPAGALRPDGSPHDTGVVPALPLARRMFAGERVRFHRPLRIGESLRRETELADLSMKSGGTGTLVFATVTSRVLGADGAVALEDERRTVFREEVKAGERNQAPRRESPPNDAPWRRSVTPDPVLLFRFSALTFNSHRIHYDRAWAMEVEGYPGLVVHGPLTPTLFIDQHLEAYLARTGLHDHDIRAVTVFI